MSKLLSLATPLLATVSLLFGGVASEAQAARPARPAASIIPAAESRYAAIVVEASTGEVLYARRADSPRYPASISKIMTLYLVFEELASGRLRPTDQLTISARAASMPPTKLGLRPGDTISVDDAIRAIALRSANDMAVAVAERIGGSESRFAALMTLRAQELGMSNTHFVNASGLPDSRQISTARDIAILSRAVMRDFPQYYSYFSQRAFTFRGETITNHNRLLDRMPEVDGLKTGFISASGYNLSASGVRNGHRVIAVVLGGSSSAARDNNVQQLLTTGFDILRRRDLGETILATQSLFEPATPYGSGTTGYASAGDTSAYALASPRDDDEDTAPIYGARPDSRSLAQAGPTPDPADSRPSDAVFTSSGRAPPIQLVSPRDTPLRPAVPVGPPPASLASAPPPAAANSRPAANRSLLNSTWAVQVGAFRNRNDARDQLEDISDRFERQLRGATGVVAGFTDGYFRARFVGFDQDAAQTACAALQARRVQCMVIAPG